MQKLACVIDCITQYHLTTMIIVFSDVGKEYLLFRIITCNQLGDERATSQA